MMVQSLNEYLEILTADIFDNDQVVTYKSLSKKLEVHVNVAKQILWEFWQKHKEKAALECTIMLIGCLKEGGMRVTVVKETNLSEVKQMFSKVVSEHLYSIQKNLFDIELLATSEGDVKYSAIKCDGCVERTDKEMFALRWGTAVNDIVKASEEASMTVVKDKAPEVKQNNEVKQKSQNSNLKNDFNKLFGKSDGKEKPSNAEEKSVQAKDSLKNDSNRLFGKGVDKRKPSNTEQKSVQAKDGLKNDSNKLFGKVVDKEKAFNVESKNSVKDNVTHASKSNKQTNNQGRKRHRSKENTNPSKRSKIVVVEDSDNESSGNESSGEIIEELPPPSPDPVEVSKPTLNEVIYKDGKRRVLKVVDKTFEEDGYLVTQKVHVYESCSEEEADAPKPTEPQKREIQDKKKTKKNKQTTLTNFFKRS